MYDLGIIGLGNMGGAILRGTLNSNVFEPSKIIIYEKDVRKISYFIENGVGIANSENDVAAHCKILLIAIKPQAIESLSNKIKNVIPDGTTIVSIAAGVSLIDLKKFFGSSHNFIRVMPNTPAIINEGMTAIVPDDNIDIEEIKKVMDIFSSVGKVSLLEEDKIDVFTGAASCLPAFLYVFIEAAADAAIKNGLNRTEAYQFISQAILGAAKMVLETGLHPGELKDQVTSPKGSSIRGLMALEREGFRNAVIAAIDESTIASKKLN